ncbi:zf-HC2 domain-containing protein [candidate division WOR-3 bacterium]|nr:zf-HC2 domain-containing protein [candidate division WOR-3 bacterium]
MKCDIPIEMLNGYLDGELDEQPRQLLEAHIATCPMCQQELEALRALDARVRESEIQGPSREFMFRVNRSVMERVRHQRRFSLMTLAPVFVPAAVAAIVLIVVVNAPQPERLISLDDQVMYNEVETGKITKAKDLDLQLPDLPLSEIHGASRDIDMPSGGFANKKEAVKEAMPAEPPAPVVSKSAERAVSGEDGVGGDDKREEKIEGIFFDELNIPRNQIVRAIVDTSGNIVRVATGNTIVPETDTVLENCLKGRQVQAPMVGGRRTQLYIDFTQDAEDTGTK